MHTHGFKFQTVQPASAEEESINQSNQYQHTIPIATR